MLERGGRLAVRRVRLAAVPARQPAQRLAFTARCTPRAHHRITIRRGRSAEASRCTRRFRFALCSAAHALSSCPPPARSSATAPPPTVLSAALTSAVRPSDLQPFSTLPFSAPHHRLDLGLSCGGAQRSIVFCRYPPAANLCTPSGAEPRAQFAQRPCGVHRSPPPRSSPA